MIATHVSPGGAPRGFVLISAIAVLVLLVLTVAAGAAILSSHAHSDAKAQAQQAQAHDMGELQTAVRDYMTAYSALLTSGAPISITSLQSHSGLPTHFGSYAGVSNGVTPWLQKYKVVAVKDAQHGTRAIIYTDGPPSTALLTRSGIGGDPAFKAAQESIAQALLHAGYTAGMIGAGSTIARGTGQGFQQDVSAFLTAPLAHATAVVFVGFRNLAPPATVPDPDGPGDIWNVMHQKCNVVDPTASGPAVCKTGYHAVAHWPYCGPFNPHFVNYSAVASDVGALTLGADFVDTFRDVQFSVPWLGAPWMRVLDTRTSYSIVSLNGAPLARTQCSSGRYGYRRHLLDSCDFDKDEWRVMTVSGEKKPVLSCKQTHTKSLIDAAGNHGQQALCCATH